MKLKLYFCTAIIQECCYKGNKIILKSNNKIHKINKVWTQEK